MALIIVSAIYNNSIPPLRGVGGCPSQSFIDQPNTPLRPPQGVNHDVAETMIKANDNRFVPGDTVYYLLVFLIFLCALCAFAVKYIL